MDVDAMFDACANGQVTRVQELLDSGVDINVRDYDREDTPLHMAAAKGQKAVVETLVEQGADINAQNNRGQTALHSLVKKRFDLLALWLIRQGADINLEDDKNCSARDFALDWFQKEMDEAAEGTLPEGALEAQQQLEEERKKQEEEAAARASEAARASTPAAQAHPDLRATRVAQATAGQEVMKIYMRNESYKTIIVSPTDTARDVTVKMAKKLGLEDCAQHFDLMSTNRTDERRLTPGENVFDVKKKWVNNDGRFVVVLRRGTPAHVVTKVRAALK